MKIILAVDSNWGIGKDNEMLFHLKKDLAHFKDTTIGHVVIMGRNTYESIGQALDNRTNIVLTRNPDYTLDDAEVFNTRDEVLDYVRDLDEEIFVIGGAQIVDMFLEYCDEAIITKIKAQRDADTFLHDLDADPDFEIVETSEAMEEDGIEFTYVKYRRK